MPRLHTKKKQASGQRNEVLVDEINQGKLETRELLFFQSNSNVIEKTLGDNESIKVRPDCLVAISHTVTIKREVSSDFIWLGGLLVLSGISPRSKFVSVKGPGLIYIDMKQSRTFFRKDQLSLYLMIAAAALYMLLFLVILFDRRDPFTLAQQAQQMQAERAERFQDDLDGGSSGLLAGIFNF